MLNQVKNFSFIVFMFLVNSCVSLDEAATYTPHPVDIIDRVQAKELNCVYLYNNSVIETGWNYASATANALKVLKDQALVVQGNAVAIEDSYSTTQYRNGYSSEAASVSVIVYKCPAVNES